MGSDDATAGVGPAGAPRGHRRTAGLLPPALLDTTVPFVVSDDAGQSWAVNVRMVVQPPGLHWGPGRSPILVTPIRASLQSICALED